MRNYLLLIVFLISITSLGQTENIILTNYPEKTKGINLLGIIKNEYVITYINNNKQLIVRKYSDDLKSFIDIVPNIPVIKNKEIFYQRSEIVNDKIFHFIAETNQEKKKIDLFTYVQEQDDRPETSKFFMNEYDLSATKFWMINLDYFSNFDIKFSDDRTKIFSQAKDYLPQTELVYPMGEKTISVFDTNDLSKRINSFAYIPKRKYYTDNGIKVFNDGNLFKSDSYKLVNLTTKKRTKTKYRIIKASADTTKVNHLKFESERLPFQSFEYDNFEKDLYVTATQYDSINNKFKLLSTTYDLHTLKLKDSINVDLVDNKQIKEANFCKILAVNKDSKNNLLIITQQYEFNRSKTFITYHNITVYCLDLNTKKIKVIAEIPIKDSIQYKFSDTNFNKSIMKTNFLNGTLCVLFRDFTQNKNAKNYSEYTKYDNDNEDESIFAIKMNSEGIISKELLLNEEIQKRNMNYKQAVFIDSNKLLIKESKNKQIGILTLK